MKIQWVLFQVVERKVEVLSKPFSSREEAEKARNKFPLREQKAIAIGNVKS